jgi:hypothetical protein
MTNQDYDTVEAVNPTETLLSERNLHKHGCHSIHTLLCSIRDAFTSINTVHNLSGSYIPEALLGSDVHGVEGDFRDDHMSASGICNAMVWHAEPTR